MERYKNNLVIKNTESQDNPLLFNIRYYATSELCSQIYYACENEEIQYRKYIFKKNDRLDHLAARFYNNGLDWWIIAAASGISWWLQINENAVLRIPDQNQIKQRFNL
jgi:hypothetical protein